jgi:hypothetical protein
MSFRLEPGHPRSQQRADFAFMMLDIIPERKKGQIRVIGRSRGDFLFLARQHYDWIFLVRLPLSDFFFFFFVVVYILARLDPAVETPFDYPNCLSQSKSASPTVRAAFKTPATFRIMLCIRHFTRIRSSVPFVKR